jgi:nucleoside-diphosphate-sugar epimerase
VTNERTAFIVGATGGIGSEVATALLRRSWRVRALTRRPPEVAEQASGRLGIEWIRGDAMVAADVIAAAQGSHLIFHGANPPRYENWAGLALPMLDSSIAAAKASGARIVFPGTVYNFGPDAFPLLSERSPQRPLTRKGQIRVDMERRLETAATAGVRALIVRAGDYFGPRAGNSWFSQGLISSGRPLRSIAYPGPRAVGHAWAYLPDVAETIAQLLERDLAAFEVFHFEGHWFERGIQIAAVVRRVVGNPRLPIRSFPWWAVYAASPFVAMFREMIEMRYLWREPLRLDNAKLIAFLGNEPRTPIDEAVAITLRGLGCLEGRDGAKIASHRPMKSRPGLK